MCAGCVHDRHARSAFSSLNSGRSIYAFELWWFWAFPTGKKGFRVQGLAQNHISKPLVERSEAITFSGRKRETNKFCRSVYDGCARFLVNIASATILVCQMSQIQSVSNFQSFSSFAACLWQSTRKVGVALTAEKVPSRTHKIVAIELWLTDHCFLCDWARSVEFVEWSNLVQVLEISVIPPRCNWQTGTSVKSTYDMLRTGHVLDVSGAFPEIVGFRV